MIALLTCKDNDDQRVWVMIEVEEACIHCSKHIPELQKCNKQVHWGTDNEKQKGGDFFKAK